MHLSEESSRNMKEINKLATLNPSRESEFTADVPREEVPHHSDFQQDGFSFFLSLSLFTNESPLPYYRATTHLPPVSSATMPRDCDPTTLPQSQTRAERPKW